MSKLLLKGKDLDAKIDQFLDRKNNDVFFDDITISDKLRRLNPDLVDG